MIKYSPQLEANFRTKKRKVADLWRMDETYIKIKGKGKMHQCLGWKYWVGAEATLVGVELCSMLKQGQMINSEDKTVWEQFYSLAA